MVVGRRKLLALVVNDRRFERSSTWFSLTAPLNILTNNIRIIKRDLYRTIFTYFTNVYAIFVERPNNSTIIVKLLYRYYIASSNCVISYTYIYTIIYCNIAK